MALAFDYQYHVIFYDEKGRRIHSDWFYRCPDDLYIRKYIDGMDKNVKSYAVLKVERRRVF